MNINTVAVVTNHSISKLLKVLNTELPYPHHGLLSIYDVIIVSIPQLLNDKEIKKINNLIYTAKEHNTEVWIYGDKNPSFDSSLVKYVNINLNIHDISLINLFDKEYIAFNLNDIEIPQYNIEELKFTYRDDKCIIYLITGKRNYIYLKNNNGSFEYLVKKNKINSALVSGSSFENVTLKPLESQINLLL